MAPGKRREATVGGTSGVFWLKYKISGQSGIGPPPIFWSGLALTVADASEMKLR